MDAVFFGWQGRRGFLVSVMMMAVKPGWAKRAKLPLALAGYCHFSRAAIRKCVAVSLIAFFISPYTSYGMERCAVIVRSKHRDLAFFSEEKRASAMSSIIFGRK